MLDADRQLFEWINGFVGTWDWADNALKLLVSDFFLPVIIAAAVWALWFLGRTFEERLRNQLGFIYAAAGAGLANAIILVIDGPIGRARPFLSLEEVNVLFYRPTDPSFPSNAAAYAFGMAAGVFLVNRPLGIAVGVVALVFSFARVYAGMHYPLDVVGGALVGILTTYAFYRLMGLIQPVVSFFFRAARTLFLT